MIARWNLIPVNLIFPSWALYMITIFSITFASRNKKLIHTRTSYSLISVEVIMSIISLKSLNFYLKNNPLYQKWFELKVQRNQTSCTTNKLPTFWLYPLFKPLKLYSIHSDTKINILQMVLYSPNENWPFLGSLLIYTYKNMYKYVLKLK